ncbi:IS5 family transposase [Aminivibrio sp.]|jgi:IS5 family transposase|uniref:IS5 family transposase n=1 Tax=Aminivibrio sp. TaxID=1872489 RepID=UPI003D95DB37
MNRQKTLANASTFEKYKKPTKREKFLAEMERVVPWKELYSLIEPFYPKAGKGRPPVGLERMLRIHFLQSWFNLSDPGAEEALYDMESLRRFVGIDLGNEPVPDETTICKFRHLLEANDLGERIFQEVNAHLEEKGLKLSEGTIMDATIINAPSSTKNQDKKRDPDMHSTKKGNQYYFGMKIHVGVDRESRTVHSLVTTPANVHDSKMVEDILHGEENAVFGDSAYMGKTEEIAKKAPGALDLTQTRGTKNRKLTEEEKETNRLLSKTRSRGEHIFLIAKRIFGFSKVRYRGLAKNTNFAFVLFALSNLYMVRRDLLALTGA